jgi:hypothetical protein
VQDLDARHEHLERPLEDLSLYPKIYFLLPVGKLYLAREIFFAIHLRQKIKETKISEALMILPIDLPDLCLPNEKER